MRTTHYGGQRGSLNVFAGVLDNNYGAEGARPTIGGAHAGPPSAGNGHATFAAFGGYN